MLIDLRELLSGSQDERIEKVSIESESFDTGIAKYSILEKPEFELSITRIGKNKLEIKAESFVVLDIPWKKQRKKKTILVDTNSTWTD